MFLTEQFAHARFNLGKSKVSSGSCYLARWKAHRVISGRPFSQLVLFQHSFVRCIDYSRYSSPSAYRTIQRASGTI